MPNNIFTITYAAGISGTGSAPISPTTVAFGLTFTTPANTYTRTGYIFGGWSDSSATYAALATYPATGSVSSNVTLTATWKSINASLSALSLSSGTLAPVFASNITSYAATVLYAVSSGYTVTATKGDSNASFVQYLGPTGTTTFTGALSVGANVIRTVVTAQDGTTIATYTVTVTRALATALTPLFGTPTTPADGFTVSITNYSTSYTWGSSATPSGSVAINGSGLITVTGVGPGRLSTVTITTTRSDYVDGSATVSASANKVAATTSVFAPTTGAELTSIRTTYLLTNPIVARVNTSSKVTFLANNKAIPGCTSVKTVVSGLTHTATCQYRPTSLGTLIISATVSPNDSGYLAVTRSIKVAVSPR